MGDEHMSDEEIAEFLAGLRKMIGRYLDNYFRDEFIDEDDV